MLGILLHAQIERIRRNKDLAEHFALVLVETAGGPQRMAVLMVEAIPPWVMGLQLSLVAPEKHSLILTLKQEAYDMRYRSLFKPDAEEPVQPPPGPQSAPSSHSALSMTHQADLRTLLRLLVETTGRAQAELARELSETFRVAAIEAIADELWPDVLAWCWWRAQHRPFGQ